MNNLENIHNIADGGEAAELPEQTDSTPTDSAAPVPVPVSDTSPTINTDLTRLLEEAEQRGYLRGRNEVISETVMQPSELSAESDDEDSYPSFLAHIRPGFWE